MRTLFVTALACLALVAPFTTASKASDLPTNHGGGCTIEVRVHSAGHGYPADAITAWASDGKIHGQITGSAPPHDGKVYIPVDCQFAYGENGQVCFGNGQGMARNLSAGWFADAKKNLAKGIKVLNQGDSADVLGFADRG